MVKGKILIFSVIGAVICSALCIGYSTRMQYTTKINTQEAVNLVDVDKHKSEVELVNSYWEDTPLEEIRGSILGYIDEMMDLTVTKLEDFKKENNESKIRLYENEIKRLNKILNNINMAKTKNDLREAMQVRHKDNV